jgi:hypothetical protein
MTILQRGPPARIRGFPNISHVCVQCLAGAMTAGAAATGARAWLATRVSPRARRMATAALITGGVLAAGVIGPTP